MTPQQALSVLMTMHTAAHDQLQQEALEIAISHLRNRIDVLDREYLRGWRDARRKEEVS